jgi:hypothetical protein
VSRRRRLTAVLVAVGLASGLVAGCGIPDHTAVKVEGAGPLPGSGQDPGTTSEPKKRGEATSEADFVANFLAAAAGEFATSQPRFQDYLAPSLRTNNLTFKPGVSVVDVLLTDPRPGDVFEIKVRQLGVLDASGAILPPTETADHYDLKISAGDATSGGYYVTQAPDVPLLSLEALKSFYRDHTVYFWNTQGTALVPDLRWLPQDVPRTREPTELLKMIEGGPSSWLDGVASPLPDESKLLTNAPVDGDLLTMNWSPPAVADNGENHLAQQVAWTLSSRNAGPARIQLKVNGQVRHETYDTATLLSELSYPIISEQQAYAVLDGKVRALAGSAGQGQPLPLGGAADQNVRWAAFIHREGELLGAVATTTTPGQLRVGSSAEGQITSLAPVPGIRPTSPPAWLPRSKFGLVTADDGKLYAFDAKANRSPLATGDVEGPITAVAAAPDGQRIALVAGDKLYVAPVLIGADGKPTLYPPQPIVAPLSGLTAVAWSGETTLSIGGKNADVPATIVDVTIDGVREFPRIESARGQVTMIATYPESTVLHRRSELLYQADGLAWMPRADGGQVLRTALADEPPPPPDTQQTEPAAPFYVY